MIEYAANGIRLFKFEILAKQGEIQHFVSSRIGGVSQAPFHSLNMGLHVGDIAQHVLQNRKILAEALEAEPNAFVFANQTHSANVMQATAEHRGSGFYDTLSALPDTDAIVTDTPGLWLCVQVADCVPLLLYDPVRKAIGAVHAGWRGIVKEIVNRTVEKMRMLFGTDPAQIIAGIGPSNGPCCYEVGAEVAEAARQLPALMHGVLRPSSKPDKYYFNQAEAVKLQLIGAGLDANLIETSGFCTQCMHPTFFSARASRGISGRFAAGIMLGRS